MYDKPLVNMTGVTFFDFLKSSLSNPIPDTIHDLLDNEIRTLHHLKILHLTNENI